MPKLGDFLSGKAGNAVSSPVKPIRFKVFFRDNANQGELKTNEVSAALVFIDDDTRETALADGEREARAQFPDGDPPPDLLRDRRMNHLLAKAIRDENDLRQLFAESALQLRSCMHVEEMRRIVTIYAEFIEAEFPTQIEQSQFQQLVEDAEKKSLRDLLTCFGSSLIRQALPILAGRFGVGQTGTSGAGKPAASQP